MATLPDAETLAALVRLFAAAGRLKATPRTGWLDRGVPPAETESVADHSFRVALIAWLTAGPGLDRDRVLKLALLHDLAEAETGDLTPYAPADIPAGEARRDFLNSRHVPDAERAAAKRRAESAAFARMIAGLPAATAAELDALWRELEARQSPEAKFVKQIDRLETYLQAREYATRRPDLPVASFALEAEQGIVDPLLAALRDRIASDHGDCRSPDQALGVASDSGVASVPTSPPKSNLINSKSPVESVPST